jgi:hypothetical protein
MNTRSTLLLLGIVLMAVGGTRLSMQIGLTGFNSALFAILSIGIVLVAREPARQLSARVRILEEKLEQYAVSAKDNAPTSAA